MGYVRIQVENEEQLHMTRDPSSKSWAILAALLSLGIGAAYYSIDYIIWKLAYISGAVFVGLTCMEDWEECIIDKPSKKVTFKKQSLIQKLFQATKGQKIVAADLDEAIGVRVREEDVKYGGTGFLVEILFSTGYSIGVTETATMEDRSYHQNIADKIKNFLGLDDSLEQYLDEAIGLADDNSSTTSNESFEHVERAELIEEAEEDNNDIVKEVPPAEPLEKDETESKKDDDVSS